MNFELPLYKQEKDNTCALACLRMVLAAFGTHVQESELEAQARMDPRGTPIDEIERLARHYHLAAEVQEATIEDLRTILAEGRLLIALIDRSVFDQTPRQRAQHSIRNSILHNVIPTHVTAKSVTIHDPRLPSITRKTTRLFHRAYMSLGGYCVVCSKSEEA